MPVNVSKIDVFLEVFGAAKTPKKNYVKKHQKHVIFRENHAGQMLLACFTTLSIDFGVFLSLLHGEIAKKKTRKNSMFLKKAGMTSTPPVFWANVTIETLPLTR